MKKVSYVNKGSSKKQSIIITLVTAFLCILIIIISGIYTQTGNDTYDVSNEETVPVNYEEDTIQVKQNAVNDETKDTEETLEEPENNTDSIKVFEFIMPVKHHEREIQKIFSLDALIYSVTMEDYRTHNGIDISCPIGTQVYCAEDGVVTKAGEDIFWGYTIEVEHENGYKTVYSNLSSVDMVTEGQNVKKNEILATTGQTASVEILDAPHLHFGVIKNGEDINPLDVIS